MDHYQIGWLTLMNTSCSKKQLDNVMGRGSPLRMRHHYNSVQTKSLHGIISIGLHRLCMDHNNYIYPYVPTCASYTTVCILASLSCTLAAYYCTHCIYYGWFLCMTVQFVSDSAWWLIKLRQPMHYQVMTHHETFNDGEVGKPVISKHKELILCP